MTRDPRVEPPAGPAPNIRPPPKRSFPKLAGFPRGRGKPVRSAVPLAKTSSGAGVVAANRARNMRLEARRAMDTHAEARAQARGEDLQTTSRALERFELARLVAECESASRPVLPKGFAPDGPVGHEPSGSSGGGEHRFSSPEHPGREAHGLGLGAAKVGGGEGLEGARTAALLQLVEKIELWVKAQRPSLALTLNGTFARRVEVQRAGAGQVRLRLEGVNGRLGASELLRLREALGTRGIGLASVQTV